MAPKITIKIGSDTSGLKKGARESEGIVSRLGKGITHAFDIAAASVAGFAAKVAVDGVKGAIADARAQRVLEKQLQNSVKATKEQVAATEGWITKQQLAYGISDNKLRPSLARLVRSTKDITQAQKLLKLGMDISAASGKDLDTVVAALGKAQDGNAASLGRLGLGLDASLLKSKDNVAIFGELRKQFQGFADQEADTVEGKLRRLNEKWGEMQESLGLVLLEGLQPLIDWATSDEGTKVLQDFANGLGEAFKAVAEALPGIITKLKELGRTAGAIGFDPKTMLTPEVLAAATAFRLAPGGIQVKTIAALAAYAATDIGTQETEGKKVAAASKQIFSSTGLGFITNPLFDKTGELLDKLGTMGQTKNGGGSWGGNNVTVNVQTIDPAAAGTAVKKALNQIDRTGGSKTAGRGVG